MRLWMILVLVLLAGCVATEGEERLPSPASTQDMELTGAAVRQDRATGQYFIPDQGDGCGEFRQRGPLPTPIVVDGVQLPVRVSLFSESCRTMGWDYDVNTGELIPLDIMAPVPTE